VALIATCVADRYECVTERLFAVEEPRAGELLARADVDLGQFPCLANFNGGGSVGSPNHLGKALVQCAATIKSAGRRFVTKKLGSLEKCVDALRTVQSGRDRRPHRVDRREDPPRNPIASACVGHAVVHRAHRPFGREGFGCRCRATTS
jgi:hypothetical protein